MSTFKSNKKNAFFYLHFITFPQLKEFMSVPLLLLFDDKKIYFNLSSLLDEISFVIDICIGYAPGIII